MARFEVEGMSCGGCAARIARALTQVDAQARIEIDRPARVVSVESRSASAEALAAAIRAAGYEARALAAG